MPRIFRRSLALYLILSITVSSAPCAFAELLELGGVVPDDGARAGTDSSGEEDLPPELQVYLNEDGSLLVIPAGVPPESSRSAAAPDVALDGGLISGPVVGSIALNVGIDVSIDAALAFLSGETYDWSNVGTSAAISLGLLIGTLGVGAVISKALKARKLYVLLKHPEAGRRLVALFAGLGEIVERCAVVLREKGIALAGLTRDNLESALKWFFRKFSDRGRRAVEEAERLIARQALLKRFEQAVAHWFDLPSIATRAKGILGGHQKDLFEAFLAREGKILERRAVPGFDGIEVVGYKLFKMEKGKISGVLQAGEPFVKTVFDPARWDRARLQELAADLFGHLSADGTHEVVRGGVTWIGWIRNGVLQSFGVK